MGRLAVESGLPRGAREPEFARESPSSLPGWPRPVGSACFYGARKSGLPRRALAPALSKSEPGRAIPPQMEDYNSY